MIGPVTPLRTMLLMAKMRLTRQRNQIAHNLFRRMSKKKVRDGNAGKTSTLWVLTLVMALLMSFSFLQISRTALLNMQCNLVADSACRTVDKFGAHHHNLERAAAELPAAPFDHALLAGMTMELSVLFAIAVLLPLGSKELAQPDWDLEWLVTMPVERSTLLWGRVLERGASNVPGYFALMPPFAMIAWYSGFHWSAPLVALLAAALLLPLAALLHTLADTGLRMWLPASQLRNLQAVMSLFSMPFMYFVMSLGMPNGGSFTMEWARAFPAWTLWTPPGLMMQVIQAQDPARFAARAALLLAQTAALLWGGVALLRHQLRNGVVGSGARESGRGAKPAGKPAAKTPAASSAAASAATPAEAHPTAPSPVGRPSLIARLAAALPQLSQLSPIKRRELRLLGRDRNFLVQTLLLPLIIVGSQLVFNGKLNSIAELGQHHTTAAAIAFGIGVYVLMLSAFQTINNEGQVLWLLYTVPRSIESMLKEKAQLWGTLALVYPLIVFGISAWYTTEFDWQMLLLLLIVVAGIPVYSVIAVSLGVFASDPLAPDVRSRVRPTYVYLYMLLASFYTYSVYTSVWSQKLVVMVLVASLALALWQKARDALPYLLDPGAAPAPRVSTSDGLIAATMFFILQALGVWLLADNPAAFDPASVTIAFGASGALVYLLMRLVYWRNKTIGVPAILPRGADGVDGVDGGVAASLHHGVAGGLLAALAGVAYLMALRHSALWPALSSNAAALAGVSAAKLGWVFGLAVVAAPLCEEFIFRGLVFGGLRRSMPAWQAMLMSAAIFAVVHPPLSMLPVFALGLCAAWTYQRSKTLLAPMLVHGLYNAAVLWFQLWM